MPLCGLEFVLMWLAWRCLKHVFGESRTHWTDAQMAADAAAETAKQSIRPILRRVK